MRKRENNIKDWLKCQLSLIKKVDENVKVTLNHLLGLYKDQSGKCAVTGLILTCDVDCYFAASVSLKDDSVGYLPGNVELVCRAVSFVKHSVSGGNVAEFFDEFARLKVSGSQCRCTMGGHDSEEVKCPIHWSDAIRSRMIVDFFE